MNMLEHTWNYRIIKHNFEGLSNMAIHEVHYENGIPTAWQEAPATVMGDDFDDLTRDLANVSEAMKKPVLEIIKKKGKETLKEIA